MSQIRILDPLLLPSIPPKSRILVTDAWDNTPNLETGLEIALRLAPSYSKVNYINYGDILSGPRPFAWCKNRGPIALIWE